MQRYFVSPEQIDGSKIVLRGDDVHHIKNVMRFRAGDPVILCDGRGFDYVAEIADLRKESVSCRVIEQRSSIGEPRTSICVAQSLPKGDKLDWVLQKGTELGVTAFFPFTSTRSVVKLQPEKAKKRHQRWERIVKEAAEQSHRGRLPSVYPLADWKELLAWIPQYELTLIAYEREGAALDEILAQPSEASMLIIVGPEGGFSEDEVQEAKDAGAIPVSLGPRILRTETASLALVACILYAYGDMGR